MGNRGCFQGAIECVFKGKYRVFSGGAIEGLFRGNRGCFQRGQ